MRVLQVGVWQEENGGACADAGAASRNVVWAARIGSSTSKPRSSKTEYESGCCHSTHEGIDTAGRDAATKNGSAVAGAGTASRFAATESRNHTEFRQIILLDLYLSTTKMVSRFSSSYHAGTVAEALWIVHGPFCCQRIQRRRQPRCIIARSKLGRLQ